MDKDKKEFWNNIAYLIAILFFVVVASQIYVYSENKYYGWKVDNAVECCGAYHSRVHVLPPGPIFSISSSPVNIKINGGNREIFEFKGGLINLPLGEHEIIINDDNLKVYVVASEKEVPGFESLAGILAITTIFVITRKSRTVR